MMGTGYFVEYVRISYEGGFLKPMIIIG